ncbi:MAG: MATE family efflux transporter [Mariniphaga sp.]|nr:MATE family efflux transporter [Mariniphaga sp.]
MDKEIIRLSIPNIISNITIPLLGMVDLALMGHMKGVIYLGAIALGGVIFNIIYWGFSFLRMSTSGFTAQAYGRNNQNESYLVLLRSVILALVIGLLILVLQVPIEWASFKLIGGSNEVEQLARQYFRIRIWAAPVSLALFSLSGWFLGMQNARYPMIIAISVNVVNIALSVFFVFGLNMKSEGVALGTVIAQYVGFIIAIFLLRKKYRYLFVKVYRKAIFDLKILKEFFRVNTDIFIRTFCIIAVFTFFTSKSASINDDILAINSLLIQLLLFFSFFIDGFAFAGEAMVGKFIGSKRISELKRLVKKLFLWGGGMAIIFTMGYWPGIKLILNILTNNKELILQSEPFLIWAIFIPLASFASFIWDGIYIGATASKAMRNTMLIAAFFVFTPVYFFMYKIIGNHALWLGMTLFMLSRGIIQTILYKSAILRKLV